MRLISKTIPSFIALLLLLSFSSCGDQSNGAHSLDALSDPRVSFLEGTWQLQSGTTLNMMSPNLYSFKVSRSPRTLTWESKGLVFNPYDPSNIELLINCRYRGVTKDFEVGTFLDGSFVIAHLEHCEHYELITDVDNMGDCAAAIQKLNDWVAMQSCKPFGSSGFRVTEAFVKKDDSTIESTYNSDISGQGTVKVTFTKLK